MSDKRPILTYEAQINRVLPGLIPEIREQVLADAKARIGRLAAPNGSYGEAEWGFLRGVTAALAALTQPQTEIEGKPDGTWYDIPDGGGAATAAGVADADPEARLCKCGERFPKPEDGHYYGCPAQDNWWSCTIGPMPWETPPHGADSPLRQAVKQAYRDLTGNDAEVVSSGWGADPPPSQTPGPYAKAFREKFPVPEFPGIAPQTEYPDHCNHEGDPVPQAVQTEGENKCATCDGEGEYGLFRSDRDVCPTCSGTGKGNK